MPATGIWIVFGTGPKAITEPWLQCPGPFVQNGTHFLPQLLPVRTGRPNHEDACDGAVDSGSTWAQSGTQENPDGKL